MTPPRAPAPPMDLKQCGHNVSYEKPCPACDRIWRDQCIESLRAQAARWGFVLVPVQPAAKKRGDA